MYKSLLALLLSSCSSIELVHEPLRCEGVPKSVVKFTDDEKKTTPPSVLDKFYIRSQQLQIRIKRQCKDIDSHNKAHEA